MAPFFGCLPRKGVTSVRAGGKSAHSYGNKTGELMQLILTREVYAPDYTQGVFSGPFTAKIYSIEQPFADNKPGHSCVPDGLYDLVPYYSPKHACWTFCLHNAALGIFALPDMIPEYAINGRSVCEIHSANFASQLEGCIAPGLAWGHMKDDASGKDEAAVLQSKAAISVLMKVLAPDGEIEHAHGHTLLIRPETGQPGTKGYSWTP